MRVGEVNTILNVILQKKKKKKKKEGEEGVDAICDELAALCAITRM